MSEFNTDRDETKSIGELCSDLHKKGLFTVTDPDFQEFNTSVDLTYSLMIPVLTTGSAAVTEERVNTRVSIAASAHWADVTYRGGVGKHGTNFVFSADHTVDSLTLKVQAAALGTAAGAVGANPVAYGVSQARTACRDVITRYKLHEDRIVCTFELWLKVWHNYGLLKLASGAMLLGPSNWAARPVNPHAFYDAIRGLNVYTLHAIEIESGDFALIEIDPNEYEAIPYINYLLGADNNTFRWNLGAAAGVNRAPHLAHKTVAPIQYAYLARETNAVAMPVWQNRGLCGMPDGAGAVNQAVGAVDDSQLGMAISVLTRSFPIKDDCESAFWLTALGVFAEPYRGVETTKDSGDSQEGRGWDAMVHDGDVLIPKGSLATAVLTKITDSSVRVTETREIAVLIAPLFNSLFTLRKCVEMFVYILQLAARQCGITIPITMPRKSWHEMHLPGVGPLPDQNRRRREYHEGLCSCTGMDESSVIMNMLDIMADKFYEAHIPEAFTCLEYGNLRNIGLTMFDQEVNLGECLVSVHAALIPAGVINADVVGMAGVPFNIGAQLEELKFKNRSDGYYAVGVPGTLITTEPSGREMFEGDSGVGMLGHTIMLRRDSQMDDDEVYKIASGAARESPTEKITIGLAVAHERFWRYAFLPDAAFAASDELAHTFVELYADFNWLTAHDLTLVLPSNNRGRSVAASKDCKMKVSAHALARLLNGPLRGKSADLTVARMPKKRKVGKA